MPVWVDSKTGERFENDAPDAAEKAAAFGLTPLAEYEAQQRQAGVGKGFEAVGLGVKRAAAGIASAATIVGGALGPASTQPGMGAMTPAEIVPSAFTPEARELGEQRSGLTALGTAIPAVAAGILGPQAGAAGLAATIGVDVASGAGQAAVDAELENRDISGADVLRNTGLNLAFSLPLFGLGEAGRAALRAKQASLLERAAEEARAIAAKRAAAAEGADLVDAVSDPVIADDLASRISGRVSEAVDLAHSKVAGVRPPKVANNPNAQRAAIEAISDAFSKTDPEVSARIAGIMKGTGRQRIAGLRELRDELASGGDTELLRAIDGVLDRPDLWGQAALRESFDIDAVLSARPSADATPEALIDYAAGVRKIRGGEFAGIADQIEQLAERQLELRAAQALGGKPPGVPSTGIDYADAMRKMDPAEAWRFTKDGADEGLRKLEAQSVSDAFQRVDDTLKEDVAMSVKHADFVKGAESWSPAQVAKQDSWFEGMRNQINLLAIELTGERGALLKGFGSQARDLIERTMPRIVDADAVTRNFEIDQLKRGLDSIAKRLAETGPAIDDASKIWGSQRVLEVSDALRKGLEDAELFGRNAGLQAETNAAWKKLIDPYKRVNSKIAQYLGREFGVVGQAGVIRRFDPDMVERIMSGGYQKTFREDLKAAIKGLDDMMAARQANGLSRLDGLAQARADLERIRDGFDVADLIAVAKAKAKAPLGFELAQSVTKGAGALIGGFGAGLPGAAAGTAASRVASEALERVGMFRPGSQSPFTAALRKHLALARSEQGALLGDAAFYERLPAELQRQLMAAGEQGGNRAVDLASTAAEAAKRDRALTARLMVNPEAAKRMQKVTRKKSTPALERAKARASQGGSVVVGGKPSTALPPYDRKFNPEGPWANRMRKLLEGKKKLSETDIEYGSHGISDAQSTEWSYALDAIYRKEVPEYFSVPGNAYEPKLIKQIRAIEDREVRSWLRSTLGVDGNESGAVTLSSARNFALSDIAKSPMGAVTAVGGAALATQAALRDPETTTALERFSEDHDTPQQAFVARRQQLEEFARNPEGMIDMLTEEMGDIGRLSPKLEREMTEQAFRVVGYLQAHLPGRRTVSVVYPEGTPPSRAEVRQFALRWEAAVNPSTVMADARAGRLERVQLDALKELWPREYDGIYTGVLQELGTGQVTPQTRQRMSLLFGFGSEVDPALGPRTRAIVAAARSAQEQQTPPPSASSPPSGKSLPSNAGNSPAGMQSLQLGQQLQF